MAAQQWVGVQPQQAALPARELHAAAVLLQVVGAEARFVVAEVELKLPAQQLRAAAARNKCTRRLAQHKLAARGLQQCAEAQWRCHLTGDGFFMLFVYKRAQQRIAHHTAHSAKRAAQIFKLKGWRTAALLV